MTQLARGAGAASPFTRLADLPAHAGSSELRPPRDVRVRKWRGVWMAHCRLCAVHICDGPSFERVLDDADTHLYSGLHQSRVSEAPAVRRT